MTIHQIPNTVKLESFWMPFTANRQFKAEPRLFARRRACTTPPSTVAR